MKSEPVAVRSFAFFQPVTHSSIEKYILIGGAWVIVSSIHSCLMNLAVYASTLGGMSYVPSRTCLAWRPVPKYPKSWTRGGCMKGVLEA